MLKSMSSQTRNDVSSRYSNFLKNTQLAGYSERTQAPAPKPDVEEESDQAGSEHEEKKSVKDRRQDVDAFFDVPRIVDKRMKRKCPRCSYVISNFSRRLSYVLLTGEMV